MLYAGIPLKVVQSPKSGSSTDIDAKGLRPMPEAEAVAMMRTTDAATPGDWLNRSLASGVTRRRIKVITPPVPRTARN